MGPHTAPRGPIAVKITPEKGDGIDPLFTEAIEQQIADGEKKIDDMFASPFKKIPAKEGKKDKAVIDPYNPSPIKKLEEKKAKSEKYAELDKNLSFI